METPVLLYHGSSIRVDLLEPRQAEDWGFESGCGLGIYASDRRDYALAFALGCVPDGTGCCSRVFEGGAPSETRLVYVRGRPDFGGRGYLYELSPQGFRALGAGQWISEGPVVPLRVHEILVDDHLHLFRYATPEEVAYYERLRGRRA